MEKAPEPQEEPRVTRRSFEPEMVVIPRGSFRMGCLSNDDDCYDDEKPIHRVQISPFMLGKTEVTFDQYDTYVEATGVESPPDGRRGSSSKSLNA